MCVLPDHEILACVSSGEIVISNFNESSLTPNGYDLSIAEISIPESDLKVLSGAAKVPPRTMFYVSTGERVELPDRFCAQLWLRTSWIRKGIIAGLGKVDAGFHGSLTFMAFNTSNQVVEIPIGARFVQIVFETMHAPPLLTYEKRSGHYQGQSGYHTRPC